MLILALETSTTTTGIALFESPGVGFPAGRIIAENILNLPVTHSERLMPAIDHLLHEASLKARQIEGLALAQGPGSFTGLRIGVSTVKGLAYALHVPVAGVSSLEALASNVRYAPGLVCPVLDARKKEVYAALFRGNGNGKLHREGEDRVLSPDHLCGEIREETLFVGNGAEIYRELIQHRLGPLARFAPELSLPRAAHVARLAWPLFQSDRTLDLFSFTPVYLRRSEAEIHFGKKPSTGMGSQE